MISADGTRKEGDSMYNREDTRDFIAWIEILVSEGFLTKPEHCIMRGDREMIGIASCADLKGVGVPDLVRYSFDAPPAGERGEFYGSVFRKYPAVSAILLSTAPYSVACAERGAPVYPLLDDMAQMVGRKLKCMPSKFVPALAKHPAVLVRGHGALCFSSSLYDLHALALVCEKSCLAAAGSSILGGARQIPFYEAMIMRLIYRLKYSREAGTGGHPGGTGAQQ